MTTTLSPDPRSSTTASRQGEPIMEELLFELRRLVVGQDHLLECLLVALLARGHVLLEGVPGLARRASCGHRCPASRRARNRHWMA